MKDFIVRYGVYVEIALLFAVLVFVVLLFCDVSAEAGPMVDWSEGMHSSYLLGGIVMVFVFVLGRFCRCVGDCWNDLRTRKEE